MDVNFNEIFEALVFQKSYTQYLYSTLTHRHKQGSSSAHYF